MGFTSMIQKLLRFFGIEISRLDFRPLFEIEEELKHIQETSSTDADLFKEKAFTENIISSLRNLVKECRTNILPYIEGDPNKTCQDICSNVEQKIAPFLKGHIRAKTIGKQEQDTLEKDINILKGLFDKFREETETGQ